MPGKNLIWWTKIYLSMRIEWKRYARLIFSLMLFFFKQACFTILLVWVLGLYYEWVLYHVFVTLPTITSVAVTIVPVVGQLLVPYTFYSTFHLSLLGVWFGSVGQGNTSEKTTHLLTLEIITITRWILLTSNLNIGTFCI